MGEWRQVRIGDFLHRVKKPVKLLDDEPYKLVTVKMHHNGVVLRELKKGKLIGSNMYRVKPGQFILSGIDARHGAFGVIPEQLDCAIVTNDFWYFDIDEAVVSRDFFLWLTTTPLFLDACIKSSEGTTNRRRLQGDKFYNFEFHFPEISEQQRLAKKFNSLDAAYAGIKDEFEQQSEYLKLLSQAVLQDAVEGKLTAKWRKQNPVVKGDMQYDAATLLAQVKAEKERLVKEGKLRKEKPLPPIADGDKPFNLADGWVWCRLGEVADGFQYGSSTKSIKYGKFPVLRMGNIQGGQIDWTDLVYTNEEDEAKKYRLTKGDLLFNRTNSRELVGKTGLFDGQREAIFAGYLVRVSMLGKISPNYSNFVLNSKHHREWCNENKTDALGQSNINATKLRDFLFPLPPLAEQQAIVTRVDSLMAAIDELEKQVADRKEQAQMLMQTVLREAFEQDKSSHAAEQIGTL